jgi:hypothetical protein
MQAQHRRQLILFGLVTALFCAGGAVCVVLGLRAYAETQAFVARARAAEGTVTGFERREAGTGFDERANTRYARIAYVTAAGEEVVVRGPAADGLVRLETGQTVRVLYDPGDPHAARVDTFLGLWFGATALLGLGAAFILLPLLTFRQAWRWCRAREADASAAAARA